MIKGVEVREVKKLVDERGFFAEVMRTDWHDIFQDPRAPRQLRRSPCVAGNSGRSTRNLGPIG